MPESQQPWLTVVTVVKDDAEGFARTARSLAREDLDGVEWVVVDSSSDRDRIPALIELPVAYAWTPPAGVYPAMNTGLESARGDYAYFLNAGDELATKGTLAVVRRALGSSPEWMYGQVTFVSPDGSRVTPPPFDYQRERAALFARGRFPPHQGTVCRTSTLRELGGFDTGFRITADYALALRLSTVADPVQVPDVLAVFATGGVSTVGWKQSLREFHRARVEVLKPRGMAAVREQLETAAHYGRMQAARWVKRPRG